MSMVMLLATLSPQMHVAFPPVPSGLGNTTCTLVGCRNCDYNGNNTICTECLPNYYLRNGSCGKWVSYRVMIIA